MGGYNGSDYVVQAGADSHANAPGQGGTSRYEFWVEDYPLGVIWEAQPVFHGGDQLDVYLTHDPNGNTAQAMLLNVHTYQYTIVNFDAPYYDGYSADYIYEASGVPTLPYGQWGSTWFTGCGLSWVDPSGASGGGQLTDYNYIRIVMRTRGREGGAIKAQPSADAQSGDFTVTSY